jgi:hypothetical protein
MKIAFLATVSFVASGILAAPATQPATLFDPARHMRVSEVKPGMKGYGLSVFLGSTIEKFDVEVISILRNFNPRRNAVLIRCTGKNLEHTGSVQGMSGSPIYLMDDQGKARMIGAFAFGFPFAKDPIAGVQPIEYMLELPTSAHSDAEIEGGVSAAGETHRAANWSVVKAIDEIRAKWMSPAPAIEHASTSLAPLTTPISVSGLSTLQLRDLMPIFSANNLSLVQTGGAASSGPSNGTPVSIEPGSVLAAPVLTGDVQLIATGTVTEVIGDNVFGFGHPFNGEGPIALPFASGRINGIVAALTTSYKLGEMDQVRGTLNTDQSVGIAGKLGGAPHTIPIDIDLTYQDQSVPPEKYHFDLALHSTFSPMMSGMAMIAALSGSRELPRNHTIDYDITIEYADGQKIHSANRVVNGGPRVLAMEMVGPVQLGFENPFKKLAPAKITGTVKITPTALSAVIVSANLNKQKYRPGEQARGFLFYRPFRGEEASMPIEFPIPADLPDGQYQLIVGDADRFLNDEISQNPWKFAANSATEMVQALQNVASVKHDAIYLRLMRPGDGVALRRTPLPRLPASRRALLASSGRSDVTPMSSGEVKVMSTSLVFEGAAELVLTVESNPHADRTAGTPSTSPVNLNPSTPPQRTVTP